jgi:antitoxin MazE
MPHLIKIGNSRGVSIPKVLIEQAGLDEGELRFMVVEKGLLIQPVKRQARQDWEKQIREAMATYAVEEPDAEWLDSPLIDDADWEWVDETV